MGQKGQLLIIGRHDPKLKAQSSYLVIAHYFDALFFCELKGDVLIK